VGLPSVINVSLCIRNYQTYYIKQRPAFRWVSFDLRKQ
jgi:hypothetical protein